MRARGEPDRPARTLPVPRKPPAPGAVHSRIGSAHGYVTPGDTEGPVKG